MTSAEDSFAQGLRPAWYYLRRQTAPHPRA